MTSFTNALKRLASALAALGLAACASTGGPLGLSPQQEQALGEQQHPQILAAFGGEIDDPVLKNYVETIFNRLMASSDQPNADINIYVLDSPVVNAMAVPGHVYVTRGLLSLANSEAELAGVIGHEIGHVFERHIAKRVSRSNLAQIGTVAAAILTGDAQTAQAIGQGAQLYLLSFSREQEYESDQVGVRLLARAGYDPLAEADFLNSLGRWSELEARIAGVQQPPEYLKTHPNSANRVRRAAQEANVLAQSGGVGDERRRDAYLRQIDGLIYGDDPVRQGFISGNQFIHPDLGFAFNAPSGFQLRNSSQAVVGANSAGAQFQFSGTNSNDSPAAIISGPLAQSLGARFSQPQNLTIAGRPAAAARAQANTRQGAVTVDAYVIQWNGPQKWVFLFVAPSNQMARYQQAFSSTAQSLRAIDASQVNAPPARRVDVITAQPGDSVSLFANEMAFPAYQQDRFLILNGLGGPNEIRAGAQYKLVR